MAEELAIDELAWDCAAIDAHDRPLLAPRARMDRPRDHLFSCSRRAKDEDGRVGRRDLLDALHHETEPARGADHNLADILPLEACEERVAIGLKLLLHSRELLDALRVLKSHAKRRERIGEELGGFLIGACAPPKGDDDDANRFTMRFEGTDKK